MLLEICANSFQSAKNAQDAGAHRIELCQELSVGGITPSFGLIKEVKEQLFIPVHVLIRPRAGDFVYSDEEFNIMKTDIESCKSLGCEGIVTGLLKTDSTIDVERTKQLVDLAKPMQFTFHRAFDSVKDPFLALNELMQLGVESVLTSGQAETAEKGIGLLAQLIKKSHNKITIMPGGGVNETNVKKFIAIGCQEFHTSASVIYKEKSATLFSEQLTVSSPEKISAILNELTNEV
ncbi:MAG: copper homeostasis protein CutC [Winogradskyella sp.]|nr:copper homeostasis protein CutC [Winogradskyella sp.]NNF85177.1 copper homeostasis protein CutC [Winogradskyella sp.]